MSKGKLHIYAYGDIENIQIAESGEFGIVCLKNIADQVNANKEADEIVVHIHSRGGDVNEGFAIHDFLKGTGKKITTVVEGLCASIATVVAMAGSTRQMTKNSEFFIHNPWSLGMGDASALQKQADAVKAAETKLIEFYNSVTGIDKDQISAMMKEETSMTPQKALENKFITEIVEPVSARFAYGKEEKIYAKFTKPKTKKMTKAKTILSQISALLANAGIKAKEEVQAKEQVMKTKDGKELTISMAGDAPAKGDKVSYEGQPTPDASYEMEDGSTIKTDAESLISEIIAATPEATAEEQVKALNEKVQKLEAENKTIKAEKEEIENQLPTILSKVEELSKQISSKHIPDEDDPKFVNGKHKKVGEDEDRVSAHRNRKKEGAKK